MKKICAPKSKWNYAVYAIFAFYLLIINGAFVLLAAEPNDEKFGITNPLFQFAAAVNFVIIFVAAKIIINRRNSIEYDGEKLILKSRTRTLKNNFSNLKSITQVYGEIYFFSRYRGRLNTNTEYSWRFDFYDRKPFEVFLDKTPNDRDMKKFLRFVRTTHKHVEIKICP